MNVNLKGSVAPRTIVSLYILVVAAILLAVGQFSGAAADTSLQRAGTGALWLSVVQGEMPLASTAHLVGPEVRLNTPEGVFTGPEGVHQFSSTLRDSFSYLDFAITSTEDVNGLVIVSFTMTGINTAPYLGLPAECGGVAVDGVAVLSIGDSGIREQWIGYDQDTLRAQITAFNQISSDNRPSCNFVPAPVPAPAPEPDLPTCARKDRCDAWS